MATAVRPLGLLHMRPLQHCLHSGGHQPVLSPNLQPVVRPFVSTGRSPPRTSVQACCGIHRCLCHGTPLLSGLLTGPQLHWHINCLELLAVHLALGCLKGLLCCKHLLIRTEGTATIAYINRQSGQWSHCMWQLARHLLLWSEKHLRFASRHSYPRRTQSSNRQAFTTSCASGRVKPPSPGGPGDY